MAAFTVTITSLSIDAVSPCASLLLCLPAHCFPRESLTSFIRVLGRRRASGSDMILTNRGMCRTWVWLTSSPTHCCTGHTMSDIETLELPKHNMHSSLSVLQASVSVFGPLYGNVWQQDHLFVACVRMSSVSTEGSCKAKSSGTFILSVPNERTEGIESRILLIPISCNVWEVERRRKAMLQSALGPISIWISSENSQWLHHTESSWA